MPRPLRASANVSPRRRARSRRPYFLLRVPQLYLLFVGYYDAQGKLMLASVWQNDELAIKAGTELPAEDVLRILRPAAQGYSGRALKSGPARQTH